MANEQDQPYEEAGLIDHDEDERDDAQVNPVADQSTRRHKPQQGGATERISEEVIERNPDPSDTG